MELDLPKTITPVDLAPITRIQTIQKHKMEDTIKNIPIEKRANKTPMNKPNSNDKSLNCSITNKLEVQSTSGRRSQQGEIVCLSDYNARAGTVHIKLDIGPINSSISDENTVPTIALHDSGCSKTIMSHQLYEKLTQFEDIPIYHDDRYQAVKMASGEIQKIMGVADIALHFKGVNNCIKSFYLNVIVHNGLEQEFFLGRDFTGSDAKAFETNEHIYLTHDHECYLDSVQINLKNKKLCKVPLYSIREMPTTISSNKAFVVPPQSPITVTCHVTRKGGNGVPLKPKGNNSFEIVHLTQPRLKTVEAVYTFDNPSAIEITLFNDTHEEYYLEANTELAQINIWNSQIECYKMALTEMSPEHEYHYAQTHQDEAYETDNLTENNKIAQIGKKHMSKNRPIFIEDDEGMTEEEKEMAFLEFMKHGYHHPSMTKIIEDKAALTALDFKSTKKVSEEQWPSLFDLKHLSKIEQAIAIDIFKNNKEAFSEHDRDLGCTDMVEMHIELTSDKLQIQAYQPVPHAVREQVKQILDQLLEYGIIRECNEPSPVVSNLLICKKKDGSIRILLDGRLLNIISKRLPQNLITHGELDTFLHGKTQVTAIDLSDAFFQMPLSLDSQPFTAFFSPLHGKRFCFTRCPQGLKNSPLYLKLLMDKLFGDMADEVITYADDILIATNGTFEEHMRVVNKVLQRIKLGKIKIRPQKINLAKKEIDFLGMVWTEGKLSIPQAKTLAFQNLPSPNTPKKAKSVICALAYYRKFVPNFAQLSQPIMDLSILHPKEFKWTEQHENLFRRLIRQICKHATRYLPDPKKPFFVQTDASSFCGAGKLFQKDEEGNELLIACVSRTFTKTERAYSTIKKEVLALLYTLRTMDYYIRFSEHLTILTDAQGILFLSMCKESQGILLRFSLELSKYQAEIIHVPGENNETADVLSRHHTDIEKIQQEEGIQTPLTEAQASQILEKLKIPSGTRFTREEVATLLDVPSLPNPIDKKARKTTAKTGPRTIKNTPKMLSNRTVKAPKKSLNRPGVILPPRLNTVYVTRWYPGCNVNRKTRQDNKRLLRTSQIEMNQVKTMSYHDFRTVSKAVLTGILTPAEFRQAQAQDPYCSKILSRPNATRRFVLIDGLLFLKTGANIKLVLPQALLDLVITAKHFSIFGLHFSKTRVQRDINARYHVPHRILQEKLKTLRDNCLVCQFNKTGKEDHKLRATDYVHAPRATWGVDIIPNLPTSTNGYKAALLAVDLFTGYVQIYPLRDKTTKSLIKAIDRTIMNGFTIPKFLRTDEEPGLFRSQEFYDYLKPLGTKFLPTSVGAPWANSNAERSIRTIKDAIRNFFLQEKVEENWDQYIHFFLAAHNKSAGIYGYAPEHLMFGYDKPNEHDLLQFWPGARSHSEYMEKIVPIAEKHRQEALSRGERKRERDRSYKNVHRVVKEFKLGQIVAHRQLQLATGSAMGMKPKHTGPYIVIEINPDGCSATIEHLYTGNIMKAHFTNLQVISFHAGVGNRVDRNFDDRLLDMLSKKTTLLSKSRRELDIPITFETPPETQYATQEDEIEIEGITNVDSEPNFDSQHPHFGQLKETEEIEEWDQRRLDDSQNETENTGYETDTEQDEATQQSFHIQYCPCLDCQEFCPLCKAEESPDFDEADFPNHPILLEYKADIVKQIEQHYREINEGKILNPKHLKDQNSTQNSDSNANESLWLSDSYNLLHHNGRIKRDQPQSSNISLTNSEKSDTYIQSQTLATEGENDHYQIEEEGATERENTPISKKGESNSNSQPSLVESKLIDRAAQQPATRATPQVYVEKHHQIHSHTHKQEGGTEMERQSTPYPNINLTDTDDEQSYSHHLLQMETTSCQNNPTSLPYSSSTANELSQSQSMEKFQEGDFEFAPQSNRTSTPYPDEQFYASDETSED